MCISKRFSNTGKTGNHGMQEIDILKRKMIEDKFEQENNEQFILCGTGCEFTLLGDKIPLREAIILGDYIRANNLCPFCRVTNGKQNFKFCMENQNDMQEFSFIMGDTKYYTIFKPQGYTFLPPDENNDD